MVRRDTARAAAASGAPSVWSRKKARSARGGSRRTLQFATEVICYSRNKLGAGIRRGRNGTKTIHLASVGCGRTGRTRRGWRISRTTRCNGRHRSHPLEPSRDEHTRRFPTAGGRRAAYDPDQPGDGSGCRVRRGQCDHAEASPTLSPRQAFLRCRVGGGGDRNRGVPRAHPHHFDGTREHHVREQGHPAANRCQCTHGIARGDPRQLVQETGDRRRERRRRSDDRRAGRRWTLRVVAVGAELERRTLGPGSAERDDDPRPDSVGGRRRSLPHGELVTVPQRRPAGAHELRLHGRVQRGQGARTGDWLHAHGRADLHRQVVAEQPRHELECRRSRPGHTKRPGRRRERAPLRDDELERRRYGDQLLERQVPLRLLAAVSGDPQGGRAGGGQF